MSWRKTTDLTRGPTAMKTEEPEEAERGLEDEEGELSEEEEKELRELEELGHFARFGGPSFVPMLVLNAAAVAAAMWAMYRPRPDGVDVLALAAIPPLAILLLLFGPGKYSVENGPEDVRGALGLPLFLPGIILFTRSTDIRLVDWKPLLPGTGLGMAIAAVIFLVGDRQVRRRWFMLPVLVLSFAPYSCGVLRYANAVLDRAGGEVYRAEVREKVPRPSEGDAYAIRISPWGPLRDEEEHDVGPAIYEAIELGQQVCPRLLPGRMGIGWYVLEWCDGP